MSEQNITDFPEFTEQLEGPVKVHRTDISAK